MPARGRAVHVRRRLGPGPGPPNRILVLRTEMMRRARRRSLRRCLRRWQCDEGKLANIARVCKSSVSRSRRRLQRDSDAASDLDSRGHSALPCPPPAPRRLSGMRHGPASPHMPRAAWRACPSWPGEWHQATGHGGTGTRPNFERYIKIARVGRVAESPESRVAQKAESRRVASRSK